MASSVVIEQRFVGPQGIAQGGYVGGVLARELGDGVVAGVRLHRPTPLGVPMVVERPEESLVRLTHDGEVFAECAPVQLDIDIPDLVGYDEAVAVSDLPEPLRSGFNAVPSADRCFGCGPRPDGLHLHPAAVGDGTLIACAVVFPADLVQPDGGIPLEIVWAALDCPSMWVCWRLEEEDERAVLLDRGVVTGSLAVSVRRTPTMDDSLCIQAWKVQREGRKIVGCAALVDASGDVIATARQTAIVL